MDLSYISNSQEVSLGSHSETDFFSILVNMSSPDTYSETEKERDTRRSSFLLHYMKDPIYSKDMEYRVDIRSLYGSLYLSKNISLAENAIDEAPSKSISPMTILKRKNNRVKASVYDFKGKSILISNIFDNIMAILNRSLEVILKNTVILKEKHQQLYHEIEEIDGEEEEEEEEIQTRGRGVALSLVRTLQMQQMNDYQKTPDIIKRKQGMKRVSWEFQANTASNSLSLINESLEDSNAFILEISNIRHEISKDLPSEIVKNLFEDLIKGIQKSFQSFTSSYSNLKRRVGSKPFEEYTCIKFAKDQSPALIEFKLCCQLKIFREFLGKSVIQTSFMHGIKLEELMTARGPSMLNKADKINTYGLMILGDRFTPADLRYLEGITTMSNFFSMMNPHYKKFIKQRLRMKANVKLINEDLYDFFEYYPFKYDATSSLIKAHLSCTFKLEDRNHKGLILIDVTLFLLLDLRRILSGTPY